MLGGIRGELVESHAKRERRLWLEQEIRTLDLEACALFGPVRLELLQQQVTQ